jgi:hypothetical protein
MCWISAKFGPRLLTDVQKLSRLCILQRENYDRNLLKNIITGDKTWVYDYDKPNTPEGQTVNQDFCLAVQRHLQDAV